MKHHAKKVNWISLLDPLPEEEVNIEITWTADQRTELAIRRRAKLMGFDTPTDYLRQALAAVIACNEEDTILTDDCCFPRSRCSGCGAIVGNLMRVPWCVATLGNLMCVAAGA
jgi:hypothetical protein